MRIARRTKVGGVDPASYEELKRRDAREPEDSLEC